MGLIDEVHKKVINQPLSYCWDLLNPKFRPPSGSDGTCPKELLCCNHFVNGLSECGTEASCKIINKYSHEDAILKRFIIVLFTILSCVILIISSTWIER